MKDETVIPVSGVAEIALRMAEKAGLIRYNPGDKDFEIKGQLSKAQEAGLEKIRTLMKQFGGTGVQECLNHAVFNLLDYIVLYPVEDENKFTDKKGVILPDAFLMKKGSTAHDLAFRRSFGHRGELPLCHRRQEQEEAGREVRAEGRRCDKDSVDEIEQLQIFFRSLFLIIHPILRGRCTSFSRRLKSHQ